MSKKLEDEFNPEECESFDSIEDLFAELEEGDRKWQKNHPIRAALRNFLDKIFPNGIAGGMRAYYAFQKPWEILRHMQYEVKRAWQRVFRGWDDTAVWDVGYYLAKTMPPIIRQLKGVRHGTPMFAYDGMEPDENYCYTDEQEKIANERWDTILDKIADGFESYPKFIEKGIRPEDYEKDEDYQKFQTALDLLKEYYQALWD